MSTKPRAATLITEKDGVTTTKYTKSYDLRLEIELNDDKTCSGCPCAYSTGYEMKCSALQGADLPKRVDGSYHYIGRHEKCPLVKVAERPLPERPMVEGPSFLLLSPYGRV